MDSRLNYYLELSKSYEVDEEIYKDLIVNIYKNKNQKCNLFNFLDLFQDSDFDFIIVLKATENEIKFEISFKLNELNSLIVFNSNDGKYIGKDCSEDIYLMISESSIEDKKCTKSNTLKICNFLGIKFGIKKDKISYRIDLIDIDLSQKTNDYLLISNNINDLIEFYEEETKSNTFLDRLLDSLSRSNFDYEFIKFNEEEIGKKKVDMPWNYNSIYLKNYGDFSFEEQVYFDGNRRTYWAQYKDSSFAIKNEDILDLHGNQADIEVCKLLGIKWQLDKDELDDYFISIISINHVGKYISYDINTLVNEYKNLRK